MFDSGDIAGKVAQAHALLADVAASITADTTGPAAGEALIEAIATAGQLDLLTCLLTERVDRTGYAAVDGGVSMAAWLRNTAHSSPAWATARVKLGRALTDTLPATLTAWQNGDLTFEHAAVIRQQTKNRSAQHTATLDRALAAAATASPQTLRDIATVLLEELAPDDRETERDWRTATQRVHLSDVPDGGRLDGDLDAEGTAILRAALDKYTPKPAPTSNADGTPGPPLTASHRRALALIEMARQALDFGTDHPGAANKPHLIVTISVDQLRDELCIGYLPDGTTLPATLLRQWACDAKIIPLLLGSEGQPLDVGRTSRTVTPAQRIALNERDKVCRAPGCDRPPAWCDAHHVQSWLDHGETNLDNTLLLCRKHHTAHHKGHIRIQAHGNQQFTITMINRRT